MVYLSFPVVMFWISNQAEYFEEYIVKRKVHYWLNNPSPLYYSIVTQLLLYDHIMCSHVSEGDLPTWWEIACKYSLEVFHLMQIFR